MVSLLSVDSVDLEGDENVAAILWAWGEPVWGQSLPTEDGRTEQWKKWVLNEITELLNCYQLCILIMWDKMINVLIV